jgi:maltose alpha-D-glucosyltransferase/alpha-amylase
MRARPLGGLRTRHHGNYHLGQLLATADGWAIIDFEGEPARPLYEREIKQPPLVDVASLLGSLYTVGLLAGGEQPDGARWERAWLAGTGAAFLRAYLGQAEPGGFLPREREECVRLLDVLLLERAVYELGYALDTRPDRVGVPLRGLLHLLGQPTTGR